MQKRNTKNNHSVIESIKNNDSNTLKQLYQSNYPKIEAYILKNNGNKEHAKDIFQEAFLSVWKNVKNDKFESQNDSAIHGYLYTISKNKWLDYLRSQHHKKTVVVSKINHFEAADTNLYENDDDILKEKRLDSIMHAFKGLGGSCKALLKKFYFEKKSMMIIAEELQLDAASTRNKKYRCMQKLRTLASENNK
ncbi:RNA polymerase sigma factor [Lacinutrix cladophorae]